MIKFLKGQNIFDADVEALVNPVNCMGELKGGLAAQFRDRFPGLEEEYSRRCREGLIKPGEPWIFIADDDTKIINLPVKEHWMNHSKLEWIDKGLDRVADICEEEEINSIAIPALGCSLNRLRWEDVRYLIESIFEEMSKGMQVLVYEPGMKYQVGRQTPPQRRRSQRGLSRPVRSRPIGNGSVIDLSGEDLNDLFG